MHRSTGEPCFLPDGHAESLRTLAKRDWRCPVPGCVDPITTVGGSRRHHFRHLSDTSHDGESAAHLASKGMLAAWARAKFPECGVREEETVKDPASSLHRIADVMVTWTGGGKTAFEVEYKAFTPEAWARKQADYDIQGLPCVWLLGHTRVRTVPERDYQRGDWSNAVTVPPLAFALAQAGRHVLVVNPTERMIGTVAGDREFTRPLFAGATEGWLSLDSIDDCEVDPVRGIVTPTMRRLDEAIASRRAREAAVVEARLEREREERRVQLQRDEKEREQKRQRARIQGAQKVAAVRWGASDIRRELLTRYGTVPDVLAAELPNPWGIAANQVYWHAIIYEALIHDKGPADRFTIAEVRAVLQKFGISSDPAGREFFKTLIRFLRHLEGSHLVTVVESPSKHIEYVAPTGHNVEDVPRLQQEALERRKAQEARHEAKTAENARQAEERERVAAAARDAARQYTDTEWLQRWSKSSVRAALMDAHQGAIPSFISSNASEQDSSFADALPVHWRAHLYMAHVHGQTKGHQFSTVSALNTLNASDVPIIGSSAEANRAIERFFYVFNLETRRLEPIRGDHPIGVPITYTVR